MSLPTVCGSLSVWTATGPTLTHARIGSITSELKGQAVTPEVIDTPPFVGDCYRHERRFKEVTVMSEAIASPETRTKAAKELADRYLALWNEPDADRRRRMIAELWTEDGRHILQPPQEIREIAAQPGIAMTAILEARGYEEIEARAASADEHWVRPQWLCLRARHAAGP